MNECVRVGHSNLALAPQPSLIYCASPLINPLLILHFRWNVGPYLWGRHNSHLDPRSTGPGDEILNKLGPHNHVGYVWLIQPLLGANHKWEHLSIPVGFTHWNTFKIICYSVSYFCCGLKLIFILRTIFRTLQHIFAPYFSSIRNTHRITFCGES
jgi:hypothetical protein